MLLLFGALPLRLTHVIAYGIGALLAHMPNSMRNYTEVNLRLCFPQLQDAQLRKLCRRSLQQTVCTGLEMGKAWLVDIEATLALVKETEGQEEFDEAVKSGAGVIMLAPHLGNWEVFGFHITRGIKSTFLYQPPKYKAMDDMLKSARLRSGADLAPTTRKGVAMLLSALQRGELIGVLPDQVPNRGEGGVIAPFFENPALTMTLVSKLASKSNRGDLESAKRSLRVFCGFAERLPKGQGFKVHIREAEPEIYSTDLETSAAALNRTVENSILQSPEQYQWEYKRFKKMAESKTIYES